MRISSYAISSFLAFTLICMLPANGAQFIRLADIVPMPLPGTANARPFVADISSDGSTVFGSYDTTDGARLFLYEINGGLTTLVDAIGSPVGSIPIAVSSDGKTALGRDHNNAGRSFLWSESEGVRYIYDLPVQPDMFALPRGLSGDGSIIVGNIVDFTQGSFKDTGGFIWSETNGLEIIPRLPVAGSGALYVTDISEDGSTIVGLQSAFLGSDATAIRWTSSGGTMSLGKISSLPSGTNSISANGEVIIGSAVSIGHRFRWTETTGWQMLSGLPGLGSVHTLTYNEVSADGKYIVGGQAISNTQDDPIIWDENFGARNLKTLYESVSGVPVNNSNLGQAEHVSADGTVIAGNGRDFTDGWIMIFEPSELVPEPSSLAILSLGLASLSLRFRQRHSKFSERKWTN